MTRSNVTTAFRCPIVALTFRACFKTVYMHSGKIGKETFDHRTVSNFADSRNLSCCTFSGEIPLSIREVASCEGVVKLHPC